MTKHPSMKQPYADAHLHLLIFLLAFFFRSLFLAGLDEPVLFMKYPFFAEKLASGQDIGTRLIDLSPFYLYWMTLLSVILDTNWAAAKWIQAFVGAANCVTIYFIGRNAFRREVGLLAALMTAVYGNLIILETTLEPTVFVICFNLLAVFFLQKAKHYQDGESFSINPYIAGGLFTGLSIITKPSFLLFIPLSVLWIIIGFHADARKKAAAILLFCIAAGIFVLPVTVRNIIRFNDFILVTADAGKVFYHGNGKGATALMWTGLPDEGFREENKPEPDYAHVLFRNTASALSGRLLSPSEASKFWTRRTLADLAADPVTGMIRFLKKGIFFFTDYESHFIASAYKEYRWSLKYPFLRYGIISSLGLFGMILSFNAIKRRMLLYGTLLLYLISGTLFIMQSRYRIPAAPYLCLFAGYGIFWLRAQWPGKKRRMAAGVILIGLLFLFSHQVFRSEIHSLDRWQTATKIHYQMGGRRLFLQGRYREAIDDLNTCIAMAPGFSPAYNMRGKAWAMLGNTDAALKNFYRVIALSPEMAEGYRNAGFTHLLNNEKEHAVKFLEHARHLAPQDKKVADALADLR